MSENHIREFIPEKSQEDMELLLPPFLSIWNEPENLKFLSFTQQFFDVDTVKTWFLHHLIAGIHYYASLDESNGVSGIAVIKINSIEGFEICGIGVHPKMKNHGIGHKLIEYALSTAGALGFRSVEAQVFADNTVMERLLLSLSFIPVSMDYNRRWDGADMVCMKRIL